jgi:hypothetical protein
MRAPTLMRRPIWYRLLHALVLAFLILQVSVSRADCPSRQAPHEDCCKHQPGNFPSVPSCLHDCCQSWIAASSPVIAFQHSAPQSLDCPATVAPWCLKTASSDQHSEIASSPTTSFQVFLQNRAQRI